MALPPPQIGKSSLVVQFVDNHFNEQYFPTIENTFTKTIKHNGQEYQCDIIDTAGQDEYSLISSRLSIGIDGYVLVYSVTSRPSFELVRAVHDKLIMQSGIANVPCVVVGQKGDLADQRYALSSLVVSLLVPLSSPSTLLLPIHLRALPF